MRYHLTYVRMANYKISATKNVSKRNPPIGGGNRNCCSHYGKQ